jgi:chaperonin cofactor prefoldin
VGEHIEKLEGKLLKDLKAIGQKAIEESTNVLSEQLNDRLETLEQISALQSQTIVSLRDTSKIADEKVSAVVSSIERTLSTAVPGFKLEPSAFSTPLLVSPVTEGIKSDPRELEEIKGRIGFCPKCTSTNIRRANRSGVWEEFLRLFFIAPFRCRACRHKFYRF